MNVWYASRTPCLCFLLNDKSYRTRSDGLFAVLTRLDSTSFGSYLVDPASSHMLVSKIKPCMSKYKLLYSETANGSLNQLLFI